ncbi:TetR/AcrR family transcriptional regulator [Curtobacterium sp. VKM Ac-2887]|uniref:TetR/AcrR family transcriptional regulator n=1 Tax=Curtobacterium sp. VKM Ac-2887 TaxID=2783819 RepID=UPI002B27A1A1|nr:TetR/AcrR family transcriptional regulator [Curtobacterium sp. VKM Ac-2887]
MTRDRLLDGAFDLFAALGTAASSVDAICEAAGYTRGAFYSNFASKDELFVALVDREFDRRIEHIRSAMIPADPGPASESIDALAELIEPLFPDHADDRRWVVVRSELQRYASASASAGAVFAERRDEMLERLAERVAVIAARADVALVLPAVEVARAAVAVYYEGVADALLDESLGRPPAQRATQAERVAAVVRGLSAPLR